MSKTRKRQPLLVNWVFSSSMSFSFSNAPAVFQELMSVVCKVLVILRLHTLMVSWFLVRLWRIIIAFRHNLR